MNLKKREERRRRTLIKRIKRLQHKFETCWLDNSLEEYKEKNWHWLMQLKNTGTICSCDSCGNSRHSAWYRTREKLTNPEKKALDDFKQQVQEFFDENPDLG